MTDVIHLRLSWADLPQSWLAHIQDSSGPVASPLFCLDCFATDNGGICLLSRLDRRASAHLDDMQFSLDGKPTRPSRLIGVPRGTRVDFDGVKAKVISVTWLGEVINLPVRPYNPVLDDSNALCTLIQQMDPGTIADWLRYFVKNQNAQTAVFLHRQTPDTPDEYAADVEDAIDDIDGLRSVVWIDIPFPIGHRREGAEFSRHLAPDAPGKALLDPLEPDPWRSPLVDTAILEIARSGLLSKARAVLFAHPSDLIPPNDGASIFDVAADVGFLKFAGRRVYPFALRPGAQPHHGDHNCVAFDGSGAENIWCVAPGKMPADAYWRQFRVSVVDPAPESSGFTYWRCMSIRYPTLKVGELVPKTSLIADDDLRDVMATEFDRSPKAPPSNLPAEISTKNDRILIVTTMKNEGPFILEWLAYHRAIGVTDFLVYTNDCTDGTDTMFDLLQEKGLLTHKENPYRQTGEKPQHAAYHDASATPMAANADWIICMDVDEYINIHVGDGTLADLFAAVPNANLISMTWRLFGNADVVDFVDAPIIGQFDQAAPLFIRKPHQAWGFKTLFRNAGFYKKFGVHRPKGLRPEFLDHIVWMNGSGRQMPDDILRTGWRSNASTVGYDLVTLNHYSLRSAESFLVKRDRGRVNHVDRDQGLAYWFRMNHNAETDRSMFAKIPMLNAELAILMDDPDIAEQHANCVAAHRTKIDELRARPDYADFFDDITGTRLRALSRMLHLFGNQVFTDGPESIPQDFHIGKASKP